MKTIFLHIPKAGGTTIHSVINRIYPQESIHNILIRNGRFTIPEFQALPEEEKEKIAIVKGHMAFGLHNDFPNPDQVKYFSFLRKPAGRVVSFYTYILSRSDHYIYKPVAESNMTLKDFALSNLTNELDNGQVRLISGSASHPIGATTEEHLEMAKANIEKHFIAVGFVERFNESLLLLKEKLDWKTYPYYRQLNAAKEKTAIDNDVMRQINERNHFDMKLYEWALQRFEKEVAAIPSFQHKVDTLTQTIGAFHDGHENGFRLGQKSVATRKSRLDKIASIFRKR